MYGRGVSRLRHDGDFDLYVTNFALDYNTLYQNDGRGFFKDATATAGLIYPTWPFVGWGTGFADFDNDGWQDLFVANGHVYPQVEQLERGASYKQKNQLFLSAGNGVSPRPPRQPDRVLLLRNRAAVPS